MSYVKYPEIIVELENPISGYWDGGAKDRFTFTPTFITEDGIRTHKFIRKGDIEWGSFGANFWFVSGAGASWNSAIATAIKKIRRLYNGEAKIKDIKVDWVTEHEFDW